MSTDEINRQVRAIVRFAICAENKRATIKREDLVKRVSDSRAFGAIFERAQTMLRRVFGMELVNLPVKEKNPKAAAGSQATGKSNSYILRSVLPSEETEGWAIPQNDLPYHVLLCLALTLVYTSGQELAEDTLRKMLSKFEPYIADSLGSVKDLIDTFVKEGYLSKIKVHRATSEFESFDVLWGPRAKVEYSPESIVNFLSKVFPNLEKNTLTQAVSRASA
ncbi:hypothetical protein HDU97_005538 [Phlyctochytrium planicorne]|nr:hypothetical protein HDU97_005538 [Phlyctochytrium planicorne]